MTGPILVTGATGFLGSYVVAALLRAGHTVRAVVRPGADVDALPWGDAERLELARVDLRNRGDIGQAVRGADAVIHLAAAMSGDFATRFAGTVVATEHLLAAMVEENVDRMIFCSTLSVYDYQAIAPHSALTEDSPIDTSPTMRDEYAQVKLVQEQLVREWPGRLTVLRPGMIYGPDNLWNALIGVEVAGPYWVGVGRRRQLPMTWVENTADAFVAAVDAPDSVGRTLNIIDDEPPTVGAYCRAISSTVAAARPTMAPMPYGVMRVGVAALGAINHRLLDDRAKLPGGFLPATFAARFRPLSYPNTKAKDVLGWQPRVGLREAVERSRDAASLLRVEPR